MDDQEGTKKIVAGSSGAEADPDSRSASGEASEVRPAKGASTRSFLLEQAEPSSNEVMAQLAHDLNNLLTPIVALSACLETDLQTGSSPQEQAREIRIMAERAAEFVKRTLTSLRHSAGGASVVHPGAVVHEMREVLCNLVERDITVDIQVARGTGLAFLDRARLEAALIDLVTNARDASEGSGTVRVSTSTVTIAERRACAVGWVQPGEYVAVRVSDEGNGIEEELQARIFERCFTTKPIGRGTGLGLYHVGRFVRESAGGIEVISREGAGATFSMYFPRVEVRGSVVSAASAAPSGTRCADRASKSA